MKLAPLTSFGYAVSQITIGMLLHPYQTMQSLAQDKVFSWMVLLPTAVFVGAKAVWHYIIVPLVRFVFSCSSTNFIGCDFIPFLANWLLLFCIFWQVLVLYLLIRFMFIFEDEVIE